MHKIKYTPSSKSIAKTKRIFANAISEVAHRTHLDSLKANSCVLDKPIIAAIRRSKYPYFKYKMSRYCKYVTIIMFIIIAVIALALLLVSSGTYLSAWFISIAIAVLMLFIISFPVKLVITDNDLEIHSVLEVIKIPLIDITRVQAVDRYRIKRHFAIFGSYGFGGFFGYYVDLIHFRVIRMAATKLTNLIMIQTLFNQRYIINCEYKDVFIEILRARIESARNNQNISESTVMSNDDDSDDDDDDE